MGRRLFAQMNFIRCRMISHPAQAMEIYEDDFVVNGSFGRDWPFHSERITNVCHINDCSMAVASDAKP
jgi:hypothetical protein